MDILEVRLLLTSDFGDAPDTTAGTGTNDYQTLLVRGGPSHVIDATSDILYLGASVDGETGILQSVTAGLDDQFAAGSADDEDGVLSPLDLQGTIGAISTVTLLATNRTDRVATLYGWIDLDHNGIFDNTSERTQITVPKATDNGRFTLSFPVNPAGTAGRTYARFRLSTDVAAANSTGAATDGEVEDYTFVIHQRVQFPAVAANSVRLDVANAVGKDAWFGYTVAAIGDLDRDGVDDVVVGAPHDSVGSRVAQGAIYVMFLNADGTTRTTVKIASELNGGPALNDWDHFGTSIASLGDLNGDGIVELAVGATGDDTGLEVTGAVYILNLDTDGTVQSHSKIASSLNGGPPLGYGDQLGRSVASIGDLDGDGVVDIAVGSIAAPNNTFLGIVHILFLNTNGTAKGSVVIQSPTAGDPPTSDTYFGASIASLGDLDGDGMVELAVAASDTQGGTVRILALNADGSVKHSTKIAIELPLRPPGHWNGIGAVAAIGDIDADGVNDLAYGSTGHGIVYLIRLNSDGSVKGLNGIDDPRRDRTNPSQRDTTFGTSVAFLGDRNGDGLLELAVSAPWESSGFTGKGIYILSVAPLAIPATPAVINPGSTTESMQPMISWTSIPQTTEYELWLKNWSTGVESQQTVPVSTTGTFISPAQPLGIGRHSVRVRAKNEAGTSSWSVIRDFTIVTPVFVNGVPDGLNRRPEMTWSELAGAVKYEVWVGDVRNLSTPVIRTHVSSPTLSFTPAANLAAGTYRLYVRGLAADGSYARWSAHDEFVIGKPTTITRISEQFTSRPRIEWTAIAEAAKYDVWISDVRSPSTPRIHRSTISNELSFQPDEDLRSGSYRVWVRGIAADGSVGQWSEVRAFSTGIVPEFVPLTGDVDPSNAALSWNALEGADRYELWIDDPRPGLSPLATSSRMVEGNNSVSLVLEMLGKYHMWVRALAVDGSQGNWSTAILVTARHKINGVTISAPANTNEYPKVEWPSVSGAASYEIKVDDAFDAGHDAVYVIAGNKTSATLPEPLPLGRYHISIRAVAADGTNGVWSDPRTHTSTPNPVLTVFTTSISLTPLLQWEPVPGAVSYDVVIQKPWLSSYKTVVVSRAVQSTSFIPPILPEGRYAWWVVANGPEKLRGEWSRAEFTTHGRPTLTMPQRFNFGDPDMAFTWTSIVDADHYDLWVEDGDGAIVIREQNVPGTRFTPTSPLPRGFYTIWVRGVDVFGRTSQWSYIANVVIS